LNEELEARLLEAHRFWTQVKGKEVVAIQRDFPNCTKYIKCCSDDKEFWNKYQARVKELRPKPDAFKDLRPLKGFNSPEEYVWDGN